MHRSIGLNQPSHRKTGTSACSVLTWGPKFSAALYTSKGNQIDWTISKHNKDMGTLAQDERQSDANRYIHFLEWCADLGENTVFFLSRSNVMGSAGSGSMRRSGTLYVISGTLRRSGTLNMISGTLRRSGTLYMISGMVYKRLGHLNRDYASQRTCYP